MASSAPRGGQHRHSGGSGGSGRGGGKKKGSAGQEAAQQGCTEKLLTSDVVYKKLMWHPSVDKEAVEIGYLDRFKGLKWMQLSKWRNGGSADFDSIPWHRVMKFRHDGEVFWDRDRRIERLAELFDGTLGGSAAAAAAASSSSASGGRGALLSLATKTSSRGYPRVSPISLLEYSAGRRAWKKVPFAAASAGAGSGTGDGSDDDGSDDDEDEEEAAAAAAAAAAAPTPPPPVVSSLKMVTYNVLFAKFDAGNVFEGTCRYDHIFNLVTAQSPDVVCFQECDAAFTRHLMASATVRAAYLLSDPTAGGADGTDSIVLLSKGCAAVPVAAHVCLLTPHVHAVVVELDAGAGCRSLQVTGLHLTSDMAAEAPKKRASQVACLTGLLRSAPNAVLLGDFNFGDGVENDEIDWQDYSDAWTTVCGGGGGGGYTFDPTANPLAAANSRTGIPRRLDRLFLRSASGEVAARSASLLGACPSEWVGPAQLPPPPVAAAAGSAADEDDAGTSHPHSSRPPPPPSVKGSGVVRVTRPLRIVVRGLQGAGKSTLSACLTALLGGARVALNPAGVAADSAAPYASLRAAAAAAAAAPSCVVADGPHGCAADVACTLATMGGGGGGAATACTTVLVDVRTPLAECAARLNAAGSVLGQSVGDVLVATQAVWEDTDSVVAASGGAFAAAVTVCEEEAGAGCLRAAARRILATLEGCGAVAAGAAAAAATAANALFDVAVLGKQVTKGRPFALLPPSDHAGLVFTLEVGGRRHGGRGDGDGEDGDGGDEGELRPTASSSSSSSVSAAAATTPAAAAGLPRRALLPPVTGPFHNRFALAFVVPEYVAERTGLARMRRDLDKASEKWPPHVNLMWPFLEKPAFDAHRERLAAAVKACGVAPFRVSLSSPAANHDAARDRASLHLSPGDAAGAAMRAVRAAVAAHVSNPEERAFAPHLTVGRVPLADEAATWQRYGFAPPAGGGKAGARKKAEATAAAAAADEGFVVTEVVVLAARTDGGPMEVVDSLQLPTVDEVAAAAAAAAASSAGGGDGSRLWGDVRSEPVFPVETPKWLLEPHPLGGRKTLSTYRPDDALENFLLHLTARMIRHLGEKAVATLCTKAPTHVSQRGAQYHVADSYVNEFLHYWAAAVAAKADFYVEEMRGSVFRCYVDVDILLEAAPGGVGAGSFDAAHADAWIAFVLAHAAAHFKRPLVWAVVGECHGEWASVPHPTVAYKSGYRVYFQDLYVSRVTYKAFLVSLGAAFREKFFGATAAEVAEKAGVLGIPVPLVDEVMDAHSIEWERGRLFGSKKRRKNLARVYALKEVVYHKTVKSQPAAAEAAVVPMQRAKGFTEFLSSNAAELLYATSLRLWAPPAFARLSDTLVPACLDRFYYAVVPDCGGGGAAATKTRAVLDLVSLKISAHDSTKHREVLTTVLGFDRPPALDGHAFTPMAALCAETTGLPFSAEDAAAAGSLVAHVQAILEAYRGGMTEVVTTSMARAEWRRLLVSDSAEL